MRAAMSTVKNMGTVGSSGLMGVLTKGIGKMTILRGMGFLSFLMVENILGPGRNLKCMGMGFLYGLMGDFMRADMLMIRNKGMVCSRYLRR